ncbi:MAG: polysaccharide deacetylase family protein [Blastococcus sp.]
MDRRGFLLVLAAGLAGAAVGRGTTDLVNAGPTPSRTPAPAAAVTSTKPLGVVPVLPPTGVVDVLPGEGNSLALTIDDGSDSEVVGAFIAFAADTGVRLTFFPNGCYRSWEDNASALQPLVDSGQIALGNHTWSHPDLTTLSDAEVAEEIGRNRDFLRNMFGVRGTPFLRPPFGSRDERIDRIAAGEGHPTVVLWNGTFDDARVVTGADLMAAADECLTAQAIVVGHANQPAVTTVYDELVELIAQRELHTVTLADVWATPAQLVRGASAKGEAVSS